MEFYKKIFGDVNFNSLRGAKVKTKLGTLATLTKLIYNGFTHNLGSEDGAVVVMNNYTLWRFVAPVGRWSPEGVAGRTINDALLIVSAGCSVVPVAAWENFCSFLNDPTIEMNVNQVLHGGTSSIKVAYQNTDLPLVKVLPDFPAYARWLREHTGDAGNLPLEQFTNGDNIILPMDLYKGTPVSFTLKTPTEQPSYAQDIGVLMGDGVTAGYATKSMSGKEDFMVNPIFRCMVGMDMYVYAFADGTDEDMRGNSVTIPQGWSKWGGTSYVPYDMEANPVVIPYIEGMEWSYLAKVFTDIQWESAVEKTYRVKSDIDLSKFAGKDFMFYGAGASYEFQAQYIEQESIYGLSLVYSTGTEHHIYHYVDQDTEVDGVTIPKGWSILVEDDSEAGAHCEPYDMEANPLTVSILDGAYETTDETLCNEIVEFVEEKTVVKEELSGTITFVFTF